MKTIITDKLTALEKEYRIRMLYACESGSRGWEFPSPDSDYDVRFIYLRPLNEYLSVQEISGHLSFPISEELDIYGWDLRKVLQLMRKANTTPFEWLQSPIVYLGEPAFRERLWALAQGYFGRRSNIHHYLGIARGALDTSLNGEIKIKKLFYVLRPLLAAKWCLENNTIAPMNIGPLMTLLPDEFKAQIEALIRLKAGKAEGFTIKIDPVLKQYIDAEYATCSEASKDLQKDRFDAAPLDDFFRNTILNP